MKWLLGLCAAIFLAGLAGADTPKPRKFKTGAKRSPAHKILAAPRFKAPEKAPPTQVAYIPKQLDMWGNDIHGDCVTAEEAFAKATYQPEIFIQSSVVTAWAQANGYLEGADLASVLQSMQSGGFKVGQQQYNDGLPSTVDYTTEAVLQAAVAQGPVKIGIDSTALPSTAGNQQGWHAFGGTPGQFSNTDHCVSIAGYGSVAWLAQQLGIQVPPGAPANGYLIFTWSSIGIVDFAWIQSTCVEAWVRNPTTVGVPPLTPGPTPPTPPAPTPSGVTITLVGTNTSADGVYVPQGSVTGLTAPQISVMTVQQLAAYIAAQSRGKPKPPTPAPKPAPPMPPARPSEDISTKVIDALNRIGTRLDGIEGRLRKVESGSSSATPADNSISTRPADDDYRRLLRRIEKGEATDEAAQRLLDRALGGKKTRPTNQRKGVMRSDRVLRPNATISRRTPDVVSVAQGAADKQESYADAYRRALAENKPLLVWVGGEFCPT